MPNPSSGITANGTHIRRLFCVDGRLQSATGQRAILFYHILQNYNLCMAVVHQCIIAYVHELQQNNNNTWSNGWVSEHFVDDLIICFERFTK